MYKDVTGIILAGGNSSRMGENKSFLMLGDKTAIEITVDLMTSLFQQVILSTNNRAEYEFLGLPMYEDIYRELGPLAGIHSALHNSSTDKNFVISCDMPFMNREMIRYIAGYPTAKPVTICEAAGYIQPLAGVYNKSIEELAGRYLHDFEKKKSDNLEFEKKVCGIHSFLNQIDIEKLHPQNLNFYSDELFFNMNRPEDYKKIVSKFSK